MDKDMDNILTPLPPYEFDKYTNLSNFNHLLDKQVEEYARYFTIHPEICESVELWMKYKDERKPKTSNHYGETGLIQLLKRIYKYCLDYGPDTVSAVIKKSMSSNYQGIIWDWLEKNQNNVEISHQAYIDRWRDA